MTVRPFAPAAALALAASFAAPAMGQGPVGLGPRGARPSAGGQGLELVGVNVPNGAIWRIDRAVRLDFNRPVDPGSVNFSSVRIVEVATGLSALGSYRIDADDPSVVVFQPSCPLQPDFSDAGFEPGGTVYQLAVCDVSQCPGGTVRSTSGGELLNGTQVTFVTPNSSNPADLFFDTAVGGPLPVLRLEGQPRSDATYVEVGGSRIYIERAIGTEEILPVPPLPHNLASDPSTRVALVLQLNQSIDPSPANLAPDHVRLEYRDAGGAWRPLETVSSFESDCGGRGDRVRLDVVGVLPPGASLRGVITPLFSDRIGQRNLLQIDGFAPLSVEPAPAVLADEALEEFLSGGGAPGSLEDTSAAFAEPRAIWGGGALTATTGFEGNGGPGGNFDWRVASGEVVVFDTTSQVVVGGPNYVPTTTQVAVGGVLDVRNLLVETGGVVRAVGPNPLTILASGTVQIDGRIDVSGSDNPGVVTLNTTTLPEQGAPGQAGGGRGGLGSPLTSQSSPAGAPGAGAFGVPGGGGGGGETGWSNLAVLSSRRGAGGGGGTLGRNVPRPGTVLPGLFDQSVIGLDTEPGFANLLGDFGATSGPGGPVGGAVGPTPFVDGDDGNDFFGELLDPATGQVVVGELLTPWAGAGGGGGGDAARVPTGQTFPAVPFNRIGDEKGAGGGGGAGALFLVAIGDVKFGPAGEIVARGGNGGGGENTLFLNRVGGGSGGGSGGHVIVKTAGRIDLSATGPGHRAFRATGGQGGAGANNVGGASLAAGGSTQTTSWQDACDPSTNTTPGSPGDPQSCFGHVDGAGGDGGPGIVQLHTPTGLAGVDLPAGATLGEVSAPPPLFAGSGSFLLPGVGTASRARSKWIPLGLGGFQSGPGALRPVTFQLDGVDPVTGEVPVTGGEVDALPALLGPDAVQAAPALPFVSADGRTLVVDATPLAAGPVGYLLENPGLLRRSRIELGDTGDASNVARFEVAFAAYDAGAGTLSLTVDATGPALSGFAATGAVTAALLPSQYGVATAGVRDSLPFGASVAFQLQAAPATAGGLPDEAAASAMTSDADALNADANNTSFRFVRFEVLFELANPQSPPPSVDFLRVPFRW